MDKNINFPHLGIYLDNVGKNLSVFGFEIAYYGITIAVAMLAGMWLAMRVAKKTNQNPDTYFDMGMIAIVCADWCPSFLCNICMGYVQKRFAEYL